MRVTDVEHRLGALLEGHPQRVKAGKVMAELNKEGARLIMSGMDPEVICTLFSLHAMTMVASSKAASRISESLARDLAQDFAETVVERDVELALEGDDAEVEEQLEEQPAPEVPRNPTGDLFVNLPSMASAHLTKVRFDAEYEAMVEDIIGNFNHIVSQGVPPIIALYAMTQAYALTLGNCLRADLPWPLAQRLMRTVMRNATTFEKMVRTVHN